MRQIVDPTSVDADIDFAEAYGFDEDIPWYDSEICFSIWLNMHEVAVSSGCNPDFADAYEAYHSTLNL